MKYKICVVTTTRADYGILTPLLGQLNRSPKFDLRLAVTGTHLEKNYGMTIDEIRQDQIPIDVEIPILEQDNSAFDVSRTVANAIVGFAEYFSNRKPDLLLLLGDRTEVLGVAIAAMNEQIPIGHIHGGELTEGAVDDSVRHALTKMSSLHFPSTEEYRKRIIQMGEQPDTVFAVGAMGVENAIRLKPVTREELEEKFGLKRNKPFILVTMHPETRSRLTVEEQIRGIKNWIESHPEYDFIISKSNADQGGSIINETWETMEAKFKHVHVVASMGRRFYFSALHYCSCVCGNSSSGIIEVPSFQIPTINIGNRQKGRKAATSVIHCGNKEEEINSAVNQGLKMTDEERKQIRNPYGDGQTSARIISILEETLTTGPVPVIKQFYDMGGQ